MKCRYSPALRRPAARRSICRHGAREYSSEQVELFGGLANGIIFGIESRDERLAAQDFQDLGVLARPQIDEGLDQRPLRLGIEIGAHRPDIIDERIGRIEDAEL